MRRRTRRTRRPRRSRRRRVRSRVGGRSRSRTLVGTWWIDGSQLGQYIPGANTNVVTSVYVTSTTGQLAAYTGSTGAYNACLYFFDWSISVLTAQSPGYAAISGLYDQACMLRCLFRAKCDVSPKTEIVIAPAAQLDFSQLPSYQPDVTWVDYDGTVAVRTGTGTFVMPANGDVTDYVRNNYKAKIHRAFGGISRSFTPQHMIQVVANVANPISNNASVSVTTRQKVWQAINSNSPFSGRMLLAFSYKGALGTSNAQPLYNLAYQTGYKIMLRSPLWG